jgi:hypothetical protein
MLPPDLTPAGCCLAQNNHNRTSGNMKRPIAILNIILVLMVGFTGCSSKVSTHIDVSNLRASFTSAQSPVKSVVEKAISAIEAKDYSTAADLLRKLLSQKQLSREQIQAIRGVLDDMSPYLPSGKTLLMPETLPIR